MNVRDTIYQTVHDYPGGATALAPRMGLRPSTLLNMADPNKDSHGWSLRRFRQLIGFGGIRPLEALCQEHGGLFVPVGRFNDAPHGRLLKQLHALAREFGDVPRAIEQALKSDGRISDNELRRIERELAELVSAAAAMRGLVLQIHDSHERLLEEERP